MYLIRKHLKNRKGSTLVEFAIVLPFLMLVILGLVDISTLRGNPLNLVHLSGEAANVLSRGAAFQQTFDAIITADGALGLNGPDGLIILTKTGLDAVTVPAFAEVERRPLSVAMVLDNSYSMHPNYAGTDAISYLREAADSFVRFFDDEMDQMALTLFSTGTEVRFQLGYNFRSSIASQIRSMQAVSRTNLADAFFSGHQQLRRDTDPRASQAIVFFTDGRPTALRGIFPIGSTDVDGVIGGDQDPSGGVNNQLYEPNRLNRRMDGMRYISNTFPDGSPMTSDNLQRLVNERLLQAASRAREEGIAVYAIALGSPNHSQPWKQPDVQLLVEMANVPSGVDPRSGTSLANPGYNPNQPRGGFYFAPDATQLEGVFEQVARDIVLRPIH